MLQWAYQVRMVFHRIFSVIHEFYETMRNLVELLVEDNLEVFNFALQILSSQSRFLSILKLIWESQMFKQLRWLIIKMMQSEFQFTFFREILLINLSIFTK